jgi:hypothetical protein
LLYDEKICIAEMAGKDIMRILVIGVAAAGMSAAAAAKRIDILSVALYNNMTVDEMKQLDLSYASPFAPAWDPVLIAVNNLAKGDRGE